ncbi:deoxyribonuclease IV [bacterium]|nr:deoxyribonuclease IV [bacterium]
MRIGFHIPVSGGLQSTMRGALQRRCQTLQVFAAAPVQWQERRSDPAEDAAFVAARRRHDLHPLFVHAPYLLNLASPDRALRARSIRRLVADMRVAGAWQAEGVVLHLGSGGPDTPPRKAVQRVATALRQVLHDTDGPTRLILENSAGQGNIVGDTPEELAEVVNLTGGERLGLCLDTAHAFAAGYAIHTPEGLGALLRRLDRLVGLDRLRLIHANDSLGALGSNRDRHWHIGQGEIGPAGWRAILAHASLRPLPFVMETPKGLKTALEEDLRNLRALRRYIPREIRPQLPRKRL